MDGRVHIRTPLWRTVNIQFHWRDILIAGCDHLQPSMEVGWMEDCLLHLLEKEFTITLVNFFTILVLHWSRETTAVFFEDSGNSNYRQIGSIRRWGRSNGLIDFCSDKSHKIEEKDH